jgi:shikimate kinase
VAIVAVKSYHGLVAETAPIDIFEDGTQMARFANISLIGMPGVGKSTVGVLLAKSLSWSFLDTDLMIQVAEERTLRDIIQNEGIERFCRIEQRHVVSLDRREHVIAAGGSVVYGPAAMERLRSLGAVVHLDLPFPLLEKRLNNFNGSGIVIAPGQTLHGIFQQRQPLYQRYADLTIDCAYRSHEQIVQEIVARLR